jgi:hypothetical protein
LLDKEESMTVKTVDEYVGGLGDWQAAVVTALRKLIRETAPDATESIKWAQPVYEVNGPLCYIRAFKNHVNFGFWRGADLSDPEGLLEGSGSKMAHLKLTSLKDVRMKPLQALIRAAVKLNRTEGDPTRKRGG